MGSPCCCLSLGNGVGAWTERTTRLLKLSDAKDLTVRATWVLFGTEATGNSSWAASGPRAERSEPRSRSERLPWPGGVNWAEVPARAQHRIGGALLPSDDQKRALQPRRRACAVAPPHSLLPAVVNGTATPRCLQLPSPEHVASARSAREYGAAAPLQPRDKRSLRVLAAATAPPLARSPPNLESAGARGGCAPPRFQFPLARQRHGSALAWLEPALPGVGPLLRMRGSGPHAPPSGQFPACAALKLPVTLLRMRQVTGVTRRVQTGTRGYPWVKKWTQASNLCSQGRKVTISWDASNEAREPILPLCSHETRLEHCIWLQRPWQSRSRGEPQK
ncbi:uncharacterized protein LOC114014035 [Falco peregrinus]|uniref:uncharacterized protein LOC114014035 n=1 Tax=Falco peregrinus TaxID=8954 RepID=UPI0024794E9A|nr:uncharacterized protein LOC114014035 [Falco peregrinus]XP_055662681.1 uncharacterized protein LOC114014035 [Falco peregrinus]XP_055662682.1 uncharacterized protein LOC114014035 [Falco peregrinus]XP_055662684.1 uncharacterized protein LOC114014035 [Falco peregrinus]